MSERNTGEITPYVETTENKPYSINKTTRCI
jgi:hypothetical protein